MILPLVFLLCFTFSCQQGEEVAEEPAVDVEADVEAIRNWVNSSYAAADSGDVEGYISFWAEGVIWMPPNTPIIQGISAATEMVQPFFEQVSTHREISIKEIKVADNFAFTRINSEEKYTPRTGEGESVESNFKSIILLHRMADGTWLGTHYMWNMNDSPPMSPEKGPIEVVREAKKVVNIEADVEAIKAWFDTYTSTATAEDLDAWIDHFAEDIIAMPPNEATIKGKEVLRQWGQPFFDQFNQEELVTIKEIEVSGNWAFARFPYTLKLTPKGGGETFQANGKAIYIFRRQADGTWKVSHAIWNGNDPLPVLPEKK